MSVFDFGRLIQYGYFPKELPPCFRTTDLAKNESLVKKNISQNYQKLSIPLIYSGYKTDSTRRRFAIPNPFHFCKAVLEIINHESEIMKILTKSSFSLRAPIEGKPHENESYAMKSSSTMETKAAVEKLYQNNQIEIRLDINSCFDSIYTHSIPWAIHGIEKSKKNREQTLVGNLLDKCVQSMNYGQTNGLLVGNDVSRIVSEIILCTVDGQIQKSFDDISCCRFVDDYYIYTKDETQVKQIIALIRKELAKYQLSLNQNKVRINHSPFLFDRPWLVDMRQAIKLNTNDFLSWLINEYNKFHDPTVLKYGLKVIDFKKPSKGEKWDILQSRIINIWVCYPFLAEWIIPILWNHKDCIRKTELKAAVYSVAEQSILLGQDLELIWATWFAKVFDLRISSDFVRKVIQSNNDLAIIILLDILKTKGLCNGNSIKKDCNSLSNQLIIDDCDDSGEKGVLPWSSHWLLAYEIRRNDWFNSISVNLDSVSNDLFFSELLRKSIKFYDDTYMYSDTQFQRIIEKNSKLAKLKDRLSSIELNREDHSFTLEQIFKLFNEMIDSY